MELELIQNLPYIRCAGALLLVDTGSPGSISDSGYIRLGETTYPAGDNYLGADIASLREMTGQDLNGLIGMDILGEHKVLFDYPRKRFELDSGRIPPGRECEIGSLMGVPVAEISVCGGFLHCFLDTGASLGYLPESLTTDLAPGLVLDDFHPLCGAFSTPVWHLDYLLAGSEFEGEFGKLPPMLALALTAGGVSGILGHDFFLRQAVLFDFAAGKMLLCDPI